MFEHCPWDVNRNFNSFGNSILQLFFITTGDNNWISILMNGMRSDVTAAPGLVFFVVFFFISYGFLYSLLIVVIIMAFDPEDSIKVQLQKEELRAKVFQAIARAAELGKQIDHVNIPPTPASGLRRISIFTSLSMKLADKDPILENDLDGPSRRNSRRNSRPLPSRKASAASPVRKHRKGSVVTGRRGSALKGARRASVTSRRGSTGSNVLSVAEERYSVLRSKRQDLRSKLQNKDLDIEDAYKDVRACQLQDFMDGKYDADPDKSILWGKLEAPKNGNLRG
jgi:hypothetical protein